ncbi:hypothetical protein BGZ81_000920, partial [Podila clonocystis]
TSQTGSPTAHSISRHTLTNSVPVTASKPTATILAQQPVNSLTASGSPTSPIPHVLAKNTFSSTIISTTMSEPSTTIPSTRLSFSEYSLARTKEAFIVDFAFEFMRPVSQTRVALWTHQSVLMTGPLKKLYDLSRAVNPSLGDVYIFTTVQVPEFSVVSHRALLCYLYTVEVPPAIDSRDFIVIPMPMSPAPPNDPNVALMASTVRLTAWRDLLRLAKVSAQGTGGHVP